MRGLVIKDIMCLKKRLMIFGYVVAGVLIISVMYVLSARFGNLAMAGKEMLIDADNGLSSIDVKNMGSMALFFFMLLPIVAVGDMSNVFEADGKAGFFKVSGILPIKPGKRLLARYISIYALIAVGTGVDILLALLLSGLTDLITLAEFMGIIISTASVMVIDSALFVFFCMLLGYGKEQYAQIFDLLTMAAGLILANLSDVKRIIISIMDENATEVMNIWKALDFIKQKAWILFAVAVLVSVLSYVASFAVMKRKRGVI